MRSRNLDSLITNLLFNLDITLLNITGRAQCACNQNILKTPKNITLAFSLTSTTWPSTTPADKDKQISKSHHTTAVFNRTESKVTIQQPVYQARSRC